MELFMGAKQKCICNSFRRNIPYGVPSKTELRFYLCPDYQHFFFNQCLDYDIFFDVGKPLRVRIYGTHFIG